MDLRRFFSEVQRRHVGKTAGVYAVVGWVGIQVAATVFPLLDISDVATKVVVILIIIGFPIAIALAWAYDLTSSGLHRTAPLSEAEPLPERPGSNALYYGRALGFFGIGILVSLGAFAALSGVRHERTEKTAAGIRSIAVLPFEDMSEKHDQGYFTDGMTEELLNRLTQIPDLKIPGRTSSFAFRGTSMGADEIGARLDVEALLEGSVRREGNNVRVTVRLIDARTQDELWSNVYEREVSSVFAIQEEIASDIVNKLKLEINPQPTVAGSATIKADAAAVDAYMKGLDLWNKRTEASLRRAVEYFEQAVAKDPNFALGYAMVAQAYALLPAYGDFPAFEASSKGQAAAARALELNPSQPEAYAALGQIRQNFEWDFESAERSYRRAILFNNGYATAHQWRAEALLFLGDYEESRKEIDEALTLDPASASALHVKAYQHITRKEIGPANRALDRLLATHPEYPLALISKTSVAIMGGQVISAQPVIRRLTRGDAAFATALEMTAAAAVDPARREDAKRAIAEIEGERSKSEIALWYALAGLNDEALAMIEAAYDSGADVNLPFVLLHPAFDAIRSSEDYQSILRELHMIET